jgi:chromosome segregation ATPase
MAKRKTEANSGEQSIEVLQDRYRELHTKKIQVDTNLENATNQLTVLKEEAREKYGTDDVAALRSKLEAMKAENEEKRRAYQAELDRIEADLAAVEAKFAPVEAPPGDGEENS